MNEAKKKMRPPHRAEFKQQILSECAEPGASLARIALSHGINANVVHKWRRQAGGALPVMGAPSFVPVPLPPAAHPPPPDIQIELRRGATTVSLTRPLAAAEECAVGMQDLRKCSASTPCGWTPSRWTCERAPRLRWPVWCRSSAQRARTTPTCSPIVAPTA